jgi:hypothetical protein
MATDLAVANTILAQLGGSKFLAMTGAKHLTALPTGLMFSLPFPSAPNKIRIELDPSDTYTVRAFRVSGLTVKNRGEFTGVYADQLQTVFTRLTGLDTRL